MDKEKILSQVKNDSEKIVADRRYLHMNPETGFDLPNTLAFVEKELKAIGVEPVPCGKAGFICTIGGRKPGKVFLIRGDMDALPIEEKSGVEYASNTPGKMHACGHDCHTATMLEAARILKAHEDEIEGTVKLMFQPAEEIFCGSDDMIKAGALQNPKPDAGMMIHVIANQPFPSGMSIVMTDISNSSSDQYNIRIQGKGCHGAAPNLGIDPLTCAAHIQIALQEINAREMGISDMATITTGCLRGGAAANVIPDNAELLGTIRCFDMDLRDMIKERVKEIAEAEGKVFRCQVEVEFNNSCPTLINNNEVAADVAKFIRELNGPQSALTMQQLEQMAEAQGKKMPKGGGSEDFAFVSQEIPAVMVGLVAGNTAEGYIYPQHHPMVRFDEKALPIGASIYAYCAMRWLEEHK